MSRVLDLGNTGEKKQGCDYHEPWCQFTPGRRNCEDEEYGGGCF